MFFSPDTCTSAMSGHTADRYSIAGHSALVVQAGTLSTRGRGELNTFNVLRIGRPEMAIERYSWETGSQGFDQSFAGTFRHTPRRLDGMSVAAI